MVPTLQLPLKPWPNPALVLQVLMDVYPVHPPVLQDLLDVYPVPPPVILVSLAVYPVPRLVFQVPLDVYPVSCPVVEKMENGIPCSRHQVTDSPDNPDSDPWLPVIIRIFAMLLKYKITLRCSHGD